jgi:polar amino acid transport system permease protein
MMRIPGAYLHAALVWALGFAIVLLGMTTGLLGHTGAWARVWDKLPDLLMGNHDWWPIQGGFVTNIFMSIVSMVLATIGGGLLGIGLVSSSRWVSWPCTFVMNFLRNSPWLVLLFAMLYLLPFRITLFGATVDFPPMAKAIIGLALPTGASFAEVIRGAVQSIHTGQWESARSLGYTTPQIFRYVILPQALRRIVPGWMNLYALLMIGTALATVTGTQEVLTMLHAILATENESVITYFYLATFAMFFLYCYPITRLARRAERAVKGESL